MTEKDCLEYCFKKGFTFYGLYDKVRYFESISNQEYVTKCYFHESLDERLNKLKKKKLISEKYRKELR